MSDCDWRIEKNNSEGAKIYSEIVEISSEVVEISSEVVEISSEVVQPISELLIIRAFRMGLNMEKRTRGGDKNNRFGDFSEICIHLLTNTVFIVYVKTMGSNMNVDKRTMNIDKRTMNVDKRTMNIDKRTMNVDRRTMNIDKRTMNVDKRTMALAAFERGH